MTEPLTRAVDAPASAGLPVVRTDAERALAEFDEQLSSYLEAVKPRELVPSDREVSLGVAAGYTPPPPPPVMPKFRARTQFTNMVRALNPVSIAAGGLILPMIVLGMQRSFALWDQYIYNWSIPFVRSDLHLNFTELTTILSAVGIVSALLGPVVGYFADRVNRIRLLRVGALVSHIPSIFAGLAPTAGVFAASRIVSGVGPALVQPPLDPMLADYYPVRTRPRLYAFLQSLGLLSTLVFLVVLVFVFGKYTGWRVALVATGSLATLLSLLTFLVKEPVRGAMDREALGLPPDAKVPVQKPVPWSEAWRACRGIGTLRRLWVAEPFVQLGTNALLIFLYSALREQSVATAGSDAWYVKLLTGPYAIYFLITIPQFLGLVGVVFATPVADRLMRNRPGRIMYYAGLAQALFAVAIAAVVLSPNLLLSTILLWVSGTFRGLIEPARSTLLSVVVPARIRGQGFSSIQWFGLLGLLGLNVLGGVADQYDAKTAVLICVPVLLIGAGLLASAGNEADADIRKALAAAAADDEVKAARGRGRSKMLVARDVDVTYGGTQVLFNVDFDVDAGEIVALLGTNGAGKSTLLRAICGIHEASSGAIFLDGEDITHKPPFLNARDGIVFLPGGRAVFPTLTVRENLRAAGWLYREDEDYLAARTEEVLDFFPILRERFDTQAGNMSGGEQQQLALAQSFLMRPRLLMIDELSLGLAPAIVERLLDIVRAIHAQGTTIILVEQSVNVALTIAKRAVYMEKGAIRFDGPTEELLSRGDLVRAVFLGGTSGVSLSRTGARRPSRLDTSERALELEGISMSYGGVQALSDVSLHVDAGQIVGIIGPNGAGKTSLFDVISGFTPPDSGVVRIAGTDVTRLSPDARGRLGLSRSFQNTKLFPALTVRDNIKTALTHRMRGRNPMLAAVWAPPVRKAERQAERRAEHLIELLGLRAFADKFVNELSTGSRRLVDLACVLAVEPTTLLFDEPSSGLAQAEIEVLGPVVQRIAEETRCGVLVVEHDIPLVKGMSDRLVAMELGRVIATGEPDEVLADERVVRSYLAASNEVITRSGGFAAAVSTLERQNGAVGGSQ